VRRSDDDIDDSTRYDDQLLDWLTGKELDHSFIRERNLFNLGRGHIFRHADFRAALAVDLDRQVTVSSSSIAGSALGQGAWVISPAPPCACQISSDRCGVIGDMSCARTITACRCVAFEASDFWMALASS
jgi:hypothetical protein